MAAHFTPKHASSAEQDLWQQDYPAQDEGPSLPGMPYQGDHRSGEGHHHHRRHRHRHRGRVVAIAVAVVVAVMLAAAGTFAALLYRSAMTVRDRASSVIAQASTLEEAFESGDEEALSSVVDTIVAHVDVIYDEVSTTALGCRDPRPRGGGGHSFRADPGLCCLHSRERGACSHC